MDTTAKSLYDADFVEWTTRAADQLRRATLPASPSLRKHAEANLQRIYREAVELALVETNLAGHAANPDIPEECPYTIEALLEGDLKELWPR